MKHLFLACFLCLLSACSAFQVSPPEVTLVDVNFDQLSLLETNLKAKVRYENENDKDLSISGSVHQLSLNGIDIGKAMSDDSVTVPRLGSATQDLTFHMNNLGLLTKIQRLINSEGFNYKIKSKIYTGRGFGSQTLHVTNDGSLGINDIGK